MNKEGGAICDANDYNSGAYYGIKTDDSGNNVVTGEGNNKGGQCRFTCVEIEVFQIKFWSFKINSIKIYK